MRWWWTGGSDIETNKGMGFTSDTRGTQHFGSTYYDKNGENRYTK